MANKQSRSAKGEQAAKPQNTLRSTLVNSLAISLLACIICFGYLAFIERPTTNNANITAQSQNLAESQVSLLNQALTQLRLRLANFALSEQLLSHIAQKDEEAITRYRQELARAFPEAISTKVIALGPLGIASLNKESRQLRNNIELDLLRTVSTGQNVEPEAYKINGEWLFSLAEPIKSADKSYAVGALLLTLNQEYLQRLFGQLDNSLGQTQLIQQFKNKQHIITTSGTAEGNQFTVQAETLVSHWQLNFTPSNELIANNQHNVYIIASLLAFIALAMTATTIINYGRIQKALLSNFAALSTNKKSLQPTFTLPGFEEFAAQHSNDDPVTTDTNTDLALKKPQISPDEKTTEQNHTFGPLSEQIVDEQTHSLPDQLPETIFRAYDIRGLAETELTNNVVYAIGLAIGSQALVQGQQSIIVSTDGRHSSPRIHDAMVEGLQASGRDVIDIGCQPTPLMYFATHQLDTQSGVMITGSHNPADYNGIKIVLDGQALSGQAIQAIKQRIESRDLSSGQGDYQVQDIEQSYIDYIINDVAIAQPLKIVIDAGNGVTGGIAPQLFEELGCEVIPLFCDVDGDFPNHHPDPSVEANLEDLKRAVIEQQADLGIAFDGDGDRLGVVTASGQSVAADRLLMLLAQDVVSRNPGADVLFDVKCTRNLNALISNYGGRPIMWKTGHSFMKEKMAETGALLGGEFSGHIFFKERWFGFDDGMYAAARLIEILSTTDPDLDLQLETLPDSISSPELKVASTDTQKFNIIEQLIANAEFGNGKINTLDGLRVDFPDGWGLVRASNTTPMLILRFEADDEEALARIQQQIKEQLTNIDNSLQFGF